MRCPKCGEDVGGGAVICPRCDFILDTSFLGDDILNESQAATGRHPALAISSAGDAVVFGGLDEPVDLMFSESTGSFLTADTQDVDREIVRAPVYVGKSVQELMKAEAVLGPAPELDKRRHALSPFELHVLSFIDGRRPVARLRKKTGLSSDDLRIAVGMLAEKGAVVLLGKVAQPDIKKLLANALDDDSDDQPLEPTAEDMRLPRSGDWAERLSVGDIPELQGEPARSPWDKSGVTARPAPDRPLDEAPVPLTLPSASPAAAPRTGSGRATDADAEAQIRKSRAANFHALAHAELGKGNRVRAHVYAKLAADTDPDEPRYQALVRDWAKSARTLTSMDAALFADADLAEKHGNHQKALALMQRALEANPSAAHIHNRIALLWATRFKRFSEAADHLIRAIELEPNNVVYKNNLGKIIALADERGAQIGRDGPERSLLGKLKKAFD